MRILKITNQDYAGWVFVMLGKIFYVVRSKEKIGHHGETEKAYIAVTPFYELAFLLSVYNEPRYFQLGHTNLAVPFRLTPQGVSFGKVGINWKNKKTEKKKKTSEGEF